MKTIEQRKGTAGTCTTVRIAAEPTADNPAGFIVIDEEDFDETLHVLFEEPPPREEQAYLEEHDGKDIRKRKSKEG